MPDVVKLVAALAVLVLGTRLTSWGDEAPTKMWQGVMARLACAATSRTRREAGR